MKLVRIAFQILLCVSSSRLSYATKRDDNIITISSTATTPGSIRKTAALPSAVVPATATMQSDDTVYLVIVPKHKSPASASAASPTISLTTNPARSPTTAPTTAPTSSPTMTPPKQNNSDLGNDTKTKVNFKNNILNISIPLIANYEVGEVRVGREDATKEDVNTDYSDFIIAYECDESYPYIKKTGTTYNQGDKITICVSDESSNIVEVKKFLDLVVAQEDKSDYNFIQNGRWNSRRNSDITAPVCVDSNTSKHRVCYAKIRALARFFSTENRPYHPWKRLCTS